MLDQKTTQSKSCASRTSSNPEHPQVLRVPENWDWSWYLKERVKELIVYSITFSFDNCQQWSGRDENKVNAINVDHLASRFHTLPNAEIAQNPSKEKTQGKVPVEFTHVINPRGDPQNPPPAHT